MRQTNRSRSRYAAQVLFALLTVIATVAPVAPATAEPSAIPAARVRDWSGLVEYSRDGGASWQIIDRRKYLLPGYRLRTSADAKALIERLPGHELQDLGNNTIIETHQGTVQLWSGDLSAPRPLRGSAPQAIWSRFERHQRFTSTRRSLVDWDDPKRVQLARTIRVDDEHPELVWHHAGPGYAYRLTVAGAQFNLPPAAAPELIRFALPSMPPGDYPMQVAVLYAGEVIYESTRSSRLLWSDRKTNRTHRRQIRDHSDDPVSLAAWQIENDYNVAAMDTLRGWLDRHPDAREVRPLLAVAYGSLGLGRLQAHEIHAWNRTAPLSAR